MSEFTPATLTILAVIVGYGLGSLPFGLVLTRLFANMDIRKLGSGNIGATNVLRTGRKELALLTLLLDGGKGGLAVLIMAALASSDLASKDLASTVLTSGGLAGNDIGAIAGFAAVAGHCFPVWLRFKGGKGVATAIATICAIDFLTGLMMIACWLVVAALFRISSLAALISFFCAVIFGYFYASLTDIQMGVILCISALSIARHHENIRRLMAGEEARISFGKKGS
ncbi:MAG: putative glycerol-3-phosphate acyltransferase [Rhodospirillaceae bacterium]|nr:MAG: putative glycerol-3-phosphate acyltransferase [Rhodospirillaceae bacterium]